MATMTKYEGKNGNISWQIRYRIEQKQFTRSFPTEKEAKKFKKDIEAQIRLGQAHIESSKTFAEYTSDFLEIHTLNLKTPTKMTYAQAVKLMNKHIGDLKLKDIKAKHIDDMFVSFKKEGLSDYTLFRRKGILKLILDSAVKKEYIAKNPFDKIDFKFSKKTIRTRKVINQDELRILLNESLRMPKYRFFILLALYTGMRRGEILALKWKHINFDKKIISVKESLNEIGEVTEPKTSHSTRIIPIHDALLELLYEIKYYVDEYKNVYKNVYNDNDLVVCHEDGTYINAHTITSHFHRENNRLGIYITPHMLRHTFATLMRGSEMKDLQAILGHSSSDITLNTYQHHNNDFKHETLDKLNEVFKDDEKSVVKLM